MHGQQTMTSRQRRLLGRFTLVALALVLAAAFGSAEVAPAQAETCTSYTFTNAGSPAEDNQWSEPGNWSPHGVPGSESKCDSATIAPYPRFWDKAHPIADPTVLGIPAGVELRNLTIEDAIEVTACPTELENTSDCGGGLTVHGDLDWTAQPIGPTNLNLPLTVDGEALVTSNPFQSITLALQAGGSLTLNGSTTVTGGTLGGFTSGRPGITNNGSLTLASGSALVNSDCCVDAAQFVNNGELRVAAAPGASATVENYELVDNGTVSVGAGATLSVEAPLRFAAHAPLSGGGRVVLGPYETDLANAVFLAAGTTLETGTFSALEGTGSFEGEGKFVWTGASEVDGTLTVGSSVTTSVTPPEPNNPQVVKGTVDLEGSTSLGAGAKIQVQDGLLRNEGALTLAPGSEIDGSTFTQTAGETVLEGATIANSEEPVLLMGGILGGYGTVGSLTNAGATVRPSTTGGALRVEQGYTQSGGGTLETDVEGLGGGGEGYGQLDVLGQASLAGTLDVETLGGFTPVFGDRVHAILAGSAIGEFSTLSGGPQYGVDYQPAGTDVVFGTPGGAVPSISKLSPKKGATEGGTTVTVTGANFTEALSVKFGSTAVPYTVNSPTSITATAPAGVAASVRDVRVSTPNGTSGVTSKDHYTYLGPTITGLSPSGGPREGGTLVTVTGSGFSPGKGTTTFDFKKAAGSSVECASASGCTVIAPAAIKTGPVDVIAHVGKAKSTKNPADRYTYE